MTSLPKELLNSLILLDHFDENAFVDSHNQENKITSLRLNPFKKVELDFKLNQSVSWNINGFYIDNRPSFTHDPLFHAGCYYVQEAGSMFLELALIQTLNFSENLKILDLCAAPGGKSTLINSLLNNESLIVANELIKSRAKVLAENLSKWGTCNSIVTNNDPHKFSEISAFFDAIVIDAPCSGSGLFRKKPEAIQEWSPNNVNACFIRQQQIILDVLPSLVENGIIFYSTCSYSVKENEDIVAWMIKDHQMEYVQISIQKEWGIIDTGLGYRFYPHLTKSEGFFCAVLRKKTEKRSSSHFKRKNKVEASKQNIQLLGPFLNQLNNQLILKINNQYHLTNSLVASFLSDFEKQFYFKKAGTVIGEIKGNDLVPNQELAWSINANQSINSIELDYLNSLKFLRKENFETHNDKKGLTLLRYKSYGIGWVKILQNRTNNYLPNELKILK